MTAHWYPTSITQEQVAGGYDITLTTDTGCHLWLYWTDKEPWVHRRSTTERGLTMPWNSYWCFVDWYLIEQNEAGDTTTHTFNWLGWVVCQTKWFTFHGDIAGEESPSTGPILHKHYEYAPPPPPVETNDKYDISWNISAPAQYWNANGELFIPDHSYTARRISLLINQYALNRKGPYIVKLVKPNGACWEEPILWSYEGYSTDLPEVGDFTWTHYDDVDVPLTLGEIYRIVVHTTPGWYYWNGSEWVLQETYAALRLYMGTETPLYPRGYRIYGCNFLAGSGRWRYTTTADLCFIVWE